MDTVNLKALVEGYNRNMRALDQSLSKLEEEAESIRGQHEQREASQERIAASQREIAALKDEKSDLFGRWQQAEFDDSQDEKREIRRRRLEIEERIGELEETIRNERMVIEANEVDSTQAANLAVQRDMLRPINVADFIKKLEEHLKADAKEINERIRSISVPSSAYSQEQYDKQRVSSGDAAYGIRLSQERRLAQKDKERREKVQPVSSTDQMHTIQSGRRKPSDRMSVVASGQKVKPYTQRGGSDDEVDRSQVLSGEEIRAALAAKS